MLQHFLTVLEENRKAASACVRMAERSKALRSGRSLPWRLGFLSHFCQHGVVGFPGGSEVKASACNAGDPGSILRSGTIPWRRKWPPPLVLMPRESHGGRSLVGYSPWGPKELDTTDMVLESIPISIFSILFNMAN